jgi:hypothetical protein
MMRFCEAWWQRKKHAVQPVSNDAATEDHGRLFDDIFGVAILNSLVIYLIICSVDKNSTLEIQHSSELLEDFC